MKSWLKGGLIVAGIYILLTLVLILVEPYWHKGEGFFVAIYMLPSFVGVFITLFIPFVNSGILLDLIMEFFISLIF